MNGLDWCLPGTNFFWYTIAASQDRKLRMTARLAEKYVSILVAITFLLGAAGCGLGKIFGNNLFGCTSNCSTSTAPPPEFLFATSAGHITSFTVNQSDGGLSAPLVVAGPNQSAGMSGSVTEGYLYVSDFLNDAVDGFSISPSSGALTAIASSPFALGGTAPGGGGLSMFLQGGDTFLYATDMNAGTVAGFNYDSASGTLTAIPGSPFPAGDTPVQAVQNGVFLYVSNLNDSAGGISAYALNAQGAATPLPGSPFATGAPGSFPGPSALAIMNSFLYVALAGTATPGNQIAAFAINSDGSLTTVPGSPFTTGSGPTQLAPLPVTSTAQAFLYSANVQDGTISAFTAADGTGILTPVSGSPYTSGKSIGSVVASLTFTDSGNFFLYASDPQAMTINAYTIDGNTGALTPVSGSPFQAGSAPMLLTVVTNP
jgi:6-phosphogluconolactonase